MSLVSAPAGQQKTSRLSNLAHDPTSEQTVQSQNEVVSPLTYHQALDELKGYGIRNDLAVTLLLDDLATREKRVSENHPDIADALKRIVQRCIFIEKYRVAEALSRRALEICEAVHGKDHLGVAKQLKDLALSCLGQRKYEETKHYYRRAIDIYETKLTADDLKIAHVNFSLGWCYYERDKYKEAEELFTRALKILELKLDPNDPRVILAKKLLDSCKKHIEAEELEKRNQSTAHKRTSDAIDAGDDDKSTNLQGHVAAKKAKIDSTVDPRATSSAVIAVAPTPCPMPSSSSDETVPEGCPSLIVVTDARAKIAEIDRQLINRINEINQNSHSNLKRKIEELQAENVDHNEKLCIANRKIEDLMCSLLTYEQLVAETQAELYDKARQLSSSEEKIKNLERTHQATLAKSAKLEAEIDDKNQRLSQAEATIESSERTIAELKAETAEKRSQLAAAQQIIDSRLFCSICVAKDANRMWSKCHHVATCEQCASKLLRRYMGNSGNGVACPKCRTPGFPLEVYV